MIQKFEQFINESDYRTISKPKYVSSNIRKGFAVTIKEVYDLDVYRDEVKLFPTEKEAIAYAKELIQIESERFADDIENCEWAVEDTFEDNWMWRIYDDGKTTLKNGNWEYHTYIEIKIEQQ